MAGGITRILLSARFNSTTCKNNELTQISPGKIAEFKHSSIACVIRRMLSGKILSRLSDKLSFVKPLYGIHSQLYSDSALQL